MIRLLLILFIIFSGVNGQADLQKLAAQQKFFALIKQIEQSDYLNNPALRFSLAESYLNCAILSNILNRLSVEYALDYYEKYLDENPGDQTGWFYYGQYLVINKQYKMALDAFNKSKKSPVAGKLASVWSNALNGRKHSYKSVAINLEQSIVNHIVNGHIKELSGLDKFDFSNSKRHFHNYLCYLITTGKFEKAGEYIFQDSLKLVDYKIPARKKDNTLSYAFYYNPYLLNFLTDFFIHFAIKEFEAIKSTKNEKYLNLVNERMNMIFAMQNETVNSNSRLCSVIQKYFNYLNKGVFPKNVDNEVKSLNGSDYQGRFIYNQVINSMYADIVFNKDAAKGLDLLVNLNNRDLTNAPFYLAIYSKILYKTGLTGNLFLALDYSYDLMEKIPFARPFRAYQQALVLYKTKRGEQIK